MSNTYHGIHWNQHKIAYDLVILFVGILTVTTFIGASITIHPGMTIQTLLLRGSAFVCLVFLHIILCIGPLARINPNFLPLLYNRRHLGIALFLTAAFHGVLAIVQHHALGDTFPLVSVFTSYAQEYTAWLESPATIGRIPFEPFGIIALCILYLMAVSSHDFWLRLFGPSTWKSLHTLVYVAYALIVLHVALGFMQTDIHPVYPVFLLSSGVVVFLLHVITFFLGGRKGVNSTGHIGVDGFVLACPVDNVHATRGTIVQVGRKKVALFLHENRVFALGNVCRHQGGPIGEGRIVDGCVTCPWHGWQYAPETGTSPPPFNEHLPTYPVELRDGMVWVNPDSGTLGTCRQGPKVDDNTELPPCTDAFYIGYQKRVPDSVLAYLRILVSAILLVCPIVSVALAVSQPETERGHYEYGKTYTVDGVYYATPVPTLHVTPPLTETSESTGYNIILVGNGKFGVPPVWDSFHGKHVSLTGSAAYRREMLLLEVDRNAPPVLLGEPESYQLRPESEVVGSVRMVGELVDTKCFLGVMRPATGKTHRACAIRCLSGGVPPGILVRTRLGYVEVLLAGKGTKPLEYDIAWAGLLVEVNGTLHQQNGYSYIEAERVSLYDTADEARILRELSSE